MNYFELFGLPEAPTVDRSHLAKKYFELQRQSHPDFFTNATEEEREEALQRTAAINKAFNIFQGEDKTLEYFLQLKGVVTADEKFELPPDFLMDMMELNESSENGDDAEIIQRATAYENALKSEIQPIISEYEAGKTTPESLLQLKAYHYKKKYLKRILDRLGD